eukprot:1184430-Prorocentrum_minimum.AAC.3
MTDQSDTGECSLERFVLDVLGAHCGALGPPRPPPDKHLRVRTDKCHRLPPTFHIPHSTFKHMLQVDHK